VVHALFSNDLEKCIGSSFARSLESALEEGQKKNFARSAHPSTTYYAFLRLLAGLLVSATLDGIV
jgi:hypothetical protein